MIAYLSGNVLDKYKKRLLILVNGGAGYEVHVSAPFFLETAVGSDVRVYTYLKSSDAGLELFGFRSAEEKIFFEMLITVSGVGPRGALNILSLGSIEDIQAAIGRVDIAYLTQVSGIGRRTAERITVELKEKVGRREAGEHGVIGESLGDVVEALLGLGYSRDEARAMVKGISAEGKATEDLLREALQK